MELAEEYDPHRGRYGDGGTAARVDRLWRVATTNAEYAARRPPPTRAPGTGRAIRR